MDDILLAAFAVGSKNPEAYVKLADAYYEKFQPVDDVARTPLAG